MKTIKIHDTEYSYNGSQEAKDKCFQMLLDFFEKHNCFSGEDLQQSDNPIIDAPNVLSNILDDVLQLKEASKDTIPWSEWTEDWQKWMAIDADGTVFAYTKKPIACENFVHGKWGNSDGGSYNGTSTRIDMARLNWRKCIRERK